MTLEDEERREAVELHRKDKDRSWAWVWATVILFLILAVLFAYPTSPPTAGDYHSDAGRAADSCQLQAIDSAAESRRNLSQGAMLLVGAR